MANRYWVGGTANWDGTAGTKWSDTSGGAGGFSVPTSADDVFFSAASTGTCTISAGNTGAKSINCTGFTGTIDGTAAITVSGNVTFVAGMTYSYTGTLTINAAATLTSGGKTHGPITFNASGSTLTLGDACTLGITRTFTLTAGTIDLNGNTLSTGVFSSTNSNTRSITFGSANIALTSTTAATVVLSMATATNFTMTTSGGGFTRDMAATATLNFGGTAGGVTSNAPNVAINAGASTVTFSTNSIYKNVDFTGSTSTCTSTFRVAGNLTLATLGTYSSMSTTFVGSGTLTSNGKTIGNTTINGSGITVTLSGTCTLGNSNTFTLTAGTLDLNGNTLNTGNFSSNNSNVRAITFGSADIFINTTASGGTAIQMSSMVNFSCTTSGGGFKRDQISATTFDIGSSSASSNTNSVNVSVFGGTQTLTFTSPSKVRNLNLTGSSCGVSNSCSFAESCTLSATGNYSSFNASSTGTGTFTSNGASIANLSISDELVAGTNTLTLADSLVVGTTLTLERGIFNTNSKSVNTQVFSSSNTFNRTLSIGTSVITVTGAGASAWNCATSTNLTITGTGTISMTSASAKTFAGGGKTWPVLSNAGAGALTISGSNTFTTIQNTVQPTTFTFTSSTTQTVTNFTVSGTAGNLVTINSSSAGSQATLSKSSGTVSADYLSIQDSNASGGAVWYAGANSTNVSNNTGWIFTAPSTATGNFFFMFYP